MHPLSFLEYKNHPLSEKIVLVTATRGSGTEFLTEKPLGLFLEKSGWHKQTHIIENNKDGLCKVYNRFLTEEFKGKYVIFLHDDVMINDIFFEEKVLIAFEKYDIIGLAGSKTCDLGSPVPAWHLMSKKEDLMGEVAHSKDGHTWTTVFGPTNGRVLTLDGLFIGVNVDKVLEKGLKWDERFDFHHYDIDFTLSANNLKVKAGVFSLFVVHFGMGDSMNTEAWQQSAVKFKEKYQ